MVEKSGKSYTVKGEAGLSGLSLESRQYVELSDEGHNVCLSLEAAIAAEEQRSVTNVSFFPVTIGRSVLHQPSTVTAADCCFHISFTASSETTSSRWFQSIQQNNLM